MPALLQTAAHHLHVAEQALFDASTFPPEAFAPLAEKENLTFLSECLTRHETMTDRLRRIVTVCRKAYHSTPN